MLEYIFKGGVEAACGLSGSLLPFGIHAHASQHGGKHMLGEITLSGILRGEASQLIDSPSRNSWSSRGPGVDDDTVGNGVRDAREPARLAGRSKAARRGYRSGFRCVSSDIFSL